MFKATNFLLFTIILCISSISLVFAYGDNTRKSNSIFSKEGFYTKAKLAIPITYSIENHFHNAHEIRPSGSIIFGKDFSKNSLLYSLELEGIYNSTLIKNDELLGARTKFDSYMILANLILSNKDFTIFKTQPYIGAGVGYGKNKTNYHMTTDQATVHILDSGESDNFVYQLMIGSRYSFNKQISFLGEVRYLYLNKLVERFNLIPPSDLSSKIGEFSFNVGVKYNF